MNSSEWKARVDGYWEGLHVFAGPAFECPDCGLEGVRSDDRNAQERYDSACDSHFSWSKCESCGGLAGDRHAVHYQSDPMVFGGVDGQIISGHANVCVDCLMYIANGDVPDDA